MKASRAYITSLGTTGLLLCFALLLLVVVSALTAFRGWPGDAAGDSSTAVRIDSATRPTDVAPVRFPPAASTSQADRPAARAPAPARRAREAGKRDRGGVQGVSESGTRAPASAPAAAPAAPATPAAPAVPVTPTQAPSAGELSDKVADTTQRATQQVGATLDTAGAAPVGDVVRQTGDTTARSLPKLPLP